MQVLIFEMRRNNKILLVLISVCVLLYILIFRTKAPKQNYKYVEIKGGHPVSFYKQNLSNNATFRQPFISHDFYLPDSKETLEMYLKGQEPHFNFKPEVVQTEVDFNAHEDVIVYLHIQKAGGTVFNNHLMKDLILDKPCNCTKEMITNPCPCLTREGHVWLFSWFSVGWPCGLHADWTMLHECVAKAVDEIEGKQRNRRYFYVTLLRDPVSRYLSEWKHHRLGNHWKDAKLFCNGRNVHFFDVRPCFNEYTWEGVSFTEFLDCRDNLATNRQTRMLADLRLSKCYDSRALKPPERTKLILKHAIANVEHMAFFGLTEYQEETRKLFEHTFKLKFRRPFKTLLDDESDEIVTEKLYSRMMKYIEADVHLYQYAKQLFLERVKRISS